MTNTTAQVAEALETTPRTLRKFLRSDASGIAPVGKGSRYALPSTKRDIAALAKRFTAWDEARNAAAEAVATDEGNDTPDEG